MTTRQTPDAVREAVARETLAKQYDASMPSRAAHIRAGTSDHKAIDAILAFAALDSRAGDAREGWKLVPVEPTEAMLDAYWKQTGESKEMRSRTHAYMRRYWSAMLAATPAPAVDAVPAGEVEQ
ncbi:hypothetical protein AV944_11180 [Sphingomonas sp. LK11]|uniref:hypothetical protein n=1 Tax=Sphingomonas sp. LK11 TaxID=1390395 RepID=UPI000972D993|nr:hypothetical protein [Sphingomonas sp. LK11]APX66301.1 hypothetical protein AV944_11180 [Sphingomonas sp. LK11]